MKCNQLESVRIKLHILELIRRVRTTRYSLFQHIESRYVEWSVKSDEGISWSAIRSIDRSIKNVASASSAARDAIGVRLDTPSFIPRESIVNEATRTTNLSRGHRVIFPPGARTDRIRVGEVRPMITIHYAVHVAHVHRSSSAVYTPVTRAHPRARAKSVRDELTRAHVRKHTHRHVHIFWYLFSVRYPSRRKTTWRLKFAPRSEISLPRVMATRDLAERFFLRRTKFSLKNLLSKIHIAFLYWYIVLDWAPFNLYLSSFQKSLILPEFCVMSA